MPETHALGFRERGHSVHYGDLAFRDFVDLPHQPNDLRHLLPCFRVMASPQPVEVQPPAVTVAIPCPFIMPPKPIVYFPVCKTLHPQFSITLSQKQIRRMPGAPLDRRRSGG